MKYWIIHNGVTKPYEGEIPKGLSLETYGIDWMIVRAISHKDAERQFLMFDLGRHPIQSDLNRITRTIRVLASEGEEIAKNYFFKEYPKPFPFPSYKPREVYVLELEAIGHESQKRIREIEIFLSEEPSKRRKPWVAEIIGTDPKYKFKRVFLKHNTSYEKASSSGNRGVYYIFELEAGKIYEVRELLSWKSDRRYFCKIENNELIELDEEEVLNCLQK